MSCALFFSLQQKNKELLATVAKLQAELENERRSKELLENSLRNAERSRDEALRRNQQLERQVEAFVGKAKPM